MAIFDVRPIDSKTKRVNFELIESLRPEINLKGENRKKKLIPSEVSYSNILPVKIIPPVLDVKEEVLQELQANLSEGIDFNKEIELFGGRLVDSPTRIRPKLSYLIFKKDKKPDSDYLTQDSENLDKFRKEFSKIFSDYPKETKVNGEIKLISPPPYLPWGPEINVKESRPVLSLSPAARELDAVLDTFSKAVKSEPAPIPYKAVEEKSSKALIYFALSVASVFILTFLSVESLNLKNSILQRSNQAYINLNSVQGNLSEFNFSGAASSFALAARNFELMHEDLKKAGSVFNVLDKVTLGGTSNVSSLLKAGELISGAAVQLAAALEKISDVNLISVIQFDAKNNTETNILEVLRQFRINLIQASRNLNEADALISNSDTSLIPESERKRFEELKLSLSEFNGFIEKAVRYSDALMFMLGQSGPQRYIVLFQNTSELRPTGGFPGSYALIEFNKGTMEKFFVDDIYNPDGQMKEKIIPPRPLQKITPNWGMRDANWFSDFPASAKKVAEFYYKDTGILVDGVMAVNVDLIPEILKITGPIEMTDYGIVLDSENFIFEIQKEVEYERSKGDGQPKRILVDFGPKLLEKLSSLSRDDWMKVFAVLVAGLEKKDILGYFAEPRLENLALENGFAGEIKEAQNFDYLMIAHSNIMGSKTDAVIDNFVSLNIEKSENGLDHTLKIERRHNGGNFGFYNKKNNDYVRVLLPDGAELIEVSGNDSFESNPLLDYRQNGFVFDPDLERYESRIQKTGSIEILSEAGKKVFAFWMIVEPGQAKTVKIKYKTPNSDSIYIQKQPGLKSKFTLILNGKILFDESHSFDKNIVLE